MQQLPHGLEREAELGASGPGRRQGLGFNADAELQCVRDQEASLGIDPVHEGSFQAFFISPLIFCNILMTCNILNEPF